MQRTDGGAREAGEAASLEHPVDDCLRQVAMVEDAPPGG
jgi:hypothetical protein